MNLKDKIVVISGGTKGLGKEIAKLLTKSGCKVLICSRNKPVNDCPEDKWYYAWKQVDISKDEEVQNFINWIKKEYGKIDILINNAGFVGELKPLEKITLEELEEYININFIGTFLMTKYLLPIIDQSNESWLINISSQAGKKAVPNLSIYSV